MTTHTKRRRYARLLTPVVVLGLVAAACGSDDDDSGAEATDAPVTTDASGSTEAPAGTDGEPADGPALLPDGPVPQVAVADQRARLDLLHQRPVVG